MADPVEDFGQDLAAAVAALGVLGGHWGVPQAETERRTRRGLRI